EFGAKCSKCSRNIQSSDWVRRAKSHVYHLACFACDSCKRQLSTGEEFALQDDKVLCKTHYQESMDAGSLDKSPGSADSGGKSKTKRVRTTFTDEQLQVLQANFSLDSNPDGQDLERIAQITGLSKRVTQVWFQNSRARQKKHQQGHIGARQQQQQQQQQLSLSGGSSPTGVLTSLSSMSPNMTPPHCMTPGMGNGMQQHSPTGPNPRVTSMRYAPNWRCAESQR
ncbi:PREDICTED: LIM/homeobox protein Awh-like, partial [Priapulus caudatus]|uniref:LIM/homeobox protein Awh-like n=1 Tax=Priapulus caudatus TaxID=37621 RepID=A0ABM1F3Q5_PRICU